ncbi:MAG: deoxyribose-phosphate aldolase [Melioribacteraceae bacterium]
MKSILEISKMIDHSLLHPTYTDEFMRTELLFAREVNVASVCIKPYAICLAKEILKDCSTKVGTVVGFPHGNSSIEIKIKEAKLACENGADEIDFVVNIGKVLSQDWSYLNEEIKQINEKVISFGAISKVIFENDFYEKDELKISLCEICNEHNVAFVKTSTGYGFKKTSSGFYTYDGATDHDLQLMRKYCKSTIEVKAAGGVRELKDILRVKALGVTRVGATTTKAILKEALSLGYS